jgi:cation diffusion facilitator family transporter
MNNMDNNIALESGNPAAFSSAADPFDLSSRLQSPPEANTSRKRTLYYSPFDKSQTKTQNLTNYYDTQNKHIVRLLKPVHEHVREAAEAEESQQLQYSIAVYSSFICNIYLSGLQVYGAVASGSLSLFTTMADSIFDPLSNVTLIICNRQAKKAVSHKFPVGTSRIETAGNSFFSFIMMAVSLILVAFSCQELAEGGSTAFYLPSVIAVSVAFFVKLCLFIYCFALRNKYSQVRILWEDHRNDLFINGFGILTSVGGSKLKWWIDPMGAIILSLLILGLWLNTSIGEFKLLIGVSADADTLNLITYIAMTHSDHVQAVDTVRAYHCGPRLIIEVDVVMRPYETLKTCHDIAEDLQIKLESLPDVERAFVHVDYETTHQPEHSKKDI